MSKKYKGLLGAHMSISGGIDQAFWRGHSIGCTTIQIFTHSNRQWHCKELSQEVIESTKRAQKETGITTSVAHASYLINLGTASADTLKKSQETLGKELIHCEQLSLPYLVLHPGAGVKDEQRGLQQIAESLNILFQTHKNSVMVLLETMAGQGSCVGSTFEQLAFIRSLVEEKERVGICLDTCHIWAAGYDFSTEKAYNNLWKDFDDIIGFQHLKALHINDSLKPKNSCVDRHADIGKGTIPLKAFTLLMNDPRLLFIPKLLETPNDTLEGFAHNLQVLNSLLVKK